MTTTIEKQELYCHNCGKYVQFEVDMSLNGNHVLNCPNCGHEHCRVVKNGIITEDRWDSRNQTYIVPTYIITSTNSSTWTTSTQSSNISLSSIYGCLNDDKSVFLYNSWLNTTNYTK